MIKNFFKIIVLIIILFLLFIGYFSYFGFNTSKFNSIIKDQVKKQNSDLDIELKDVKLHLDLKNISIKIKTKNPKLILKNSEYIDLNEISSNISISSYFQNKFAIKKLSINTKKNEINSYINFYKHINNSLQLILVKQILKKGNAQVNIDLNFDDSGKIKKNFYLKGKILNTELGIPKYKNIKNLNLNFNINEKNFNFSKILFKFNEIDFNSEILNIQKKNDNFFVKGNLQNKKNKINKDMILLIFNNNLEKLDFSNTEFDSTTDFSFDLNKLFKIKNLQVDSKLTLDKLLLKHDSHKIKKYINKYNNIVNIKENKLHIKYSKKKFLINGNSEFYIDENFKNLIKFQIEKNEKEIKFDTFLNLKYLDLLVEDISYKKDKNKKATLQIKGYERNKKFFLENISYKESNNIIELNNLVINNNKIFNIDKVRFNYLTNNNFKNQVNLIKKKDGNYKLTGKSFDSIQLIKNISNSDTDKNFFEIFKNLNTKINIIIDRIKLDDKNILKSLNGNIIIKSSKINDLNLNSNFSNKEKLFVKIKTKNDNSIVTTFYSDRAKPFVKKYKFIKGFEGGTLDFSSIKVNKVSKSKLIIDNFKVKEIPVLAKILTLASLQGIADLLTGEGVRFTDFEMIYKKNKGLTTIDEIYAIGPALSIMMDGYLEDKKLISLRGTLVPATTINRTISSIPLIGDLLVGKKVGEGVFGVSFKIKGPPKNLKTKVNPIKTLTPRFITRTLEKIKKN